MPPGRRVEILVLLIVFGYLLPGSNSMHLQLHRK
jgi:hypothetical protein